MTDSPDASGPELRAWRESDRDRWNRFVERAPYHAFPQLWEWGELRAAGGWRPVRLAIGADRESPVAGVQILLRPIPLLGWHLGYAPRGPLGAFDDPAVRDALVAALRRLGREERIATLRADPEVGPSEPYGAALLAAPWRAADKVQPPRTRVVDLTRSEDELRSQMRRKHRQYVNKAERAGVVIERIENEAAPNRAAAALADFNRIYRLTAERAGFVARAPHYYERVWRLFAPTGRCRLSFASLGGERVAALFHFTCGDRAVEAYGGMTPAGAASRANYLLKWAAITDLRQQGLTTYDMWGLATGGIRQFKEGFGGSEVEYVGARDLPLRAPVDALIRVGLPAYALAQRARLGLLRRTGPAQSPD
ncbi:MAG: lipid II:glycine glycyltransferase FemX [Candidatus Limnocylindria bacterium]